MEEKLKTLGTLNANHFSADLDLVRLRTGRTTERIKIRHPEAAAVIPFLDPDHIIMVRQWRYAIQRETLEIPAGKADGEEDLAVCAHRELYEETGRKAARLIPLFEYFPAISYSDEMIRIYAASGLSSEDARIDEDEISRVEVIETAKLQDLIASGRIQDGKTVIAMSLFRAKMERSEIPSDFFR